MPPYSNNSSGSLEMRLGEMRISDRGKQNDNEYEDRSTPCYVSSLFKSKNKLFGPTEKLTVSRSQPDLSRINKADIDNYNLRTFSSPR